MSFFNTHHKVTPTNHPEDLVARALPAYDNISEFIFKIIHNITYNDSTGDWWRYDKVTAIYRNHHN